MLRHVLVPLDGSSLSESILVPLRRLIAAQDGGKLELQRVVETEDDQHIALDGASNQARTYLTGLEQELAGQGIEASILVDRGDPAERVLSRVAQTHPDLVALVTHGRTGLTRLVRGSVAEAILRRCPVPLLMMNARGVLSGAPCAPFGRILVPLDGSKLADRILPLVIAFAVPLDADVILMQVEPTPTSTGEAAQVRGRVLALLEPQRQQLAKAKINVEVHVAFGAPATGIRDAARNLGVDLVAMSTHGRGGWSRLRFGSVAESVLRECGCPLLVQRQSSA